jgi:diguanylate cyclase (GGDEF)-like protein/PAS domain S-box-containing protein
MSGPMAGVRFGSGPVAWLCVLSIVFVASSLMRTAPLPLAPEHYLPLHTALEFFSIAVAGMVFALGWNLRRSARGARLAWLGAVFLAVGLIDFAHTLSYSGMPMFVTPSGADKAIHFWLAARLIAALGLLVYAVLPERRGSSAAARGMTVAAIALALGCGWVVLRHPDSLPRGFEAGVGVTLFKLIAEYVLVALYLLAAGLLARRGVREREPTSCWLAAAAGVLALAELYFTLYVEVSDLYNILGHAYKVAAFAMIYRAVFVAGVREPQDALIRERALLRGLIDSVPDLIAFKDTKGRYLGCNKAFAEAYDLTEARLIGATDADVFPDGRTLGADEAERTVVSAPEHHEEWLEGRDGRLRLLDTLRTPYRDEEGACLGEIRISRDFTERRRIREQIAERERRVMLALEGAGLGWWDWDVPSGKASFSPVWVRMLGYLPEELAPHVSSWEALVHPEDWRDIRETLEPHLRGLTDAYRAEYRLKHKDGHWVWVLSAGRVLDRGEQGEALRVVGIHEDISPRKAMEESLLQLATSDPLTGLWNRRHFTEVVRGELGRVRRGQSRAALLLLDLDFFKRINDTYGHAAGDEVLRHFTATVSTQLREADVFARLGGEEFAILLPCIDSLGAVRVADRLRRMVADHPAQSESGPLHYSVSIGATMLDAADEGYEAGYARADEALYAAKHAGRNRVIMSSEKTSAPAADAAGADSTCGAAAAEDTAEIGAAPPTAAG